MRGGSYDGDKGVAEWWWRWITPSGQTTCIAEACGLICFILRSSNFLRQAVDTTPIALWKSRTDRSTSEYLMNLRSIFDSFSVFHRISHVDVKSFPNNSVLPSA